MKFIMFIYLKFCLYMFKVLLIYQLFVSTWRELFNGLLNKSLFLSIFLCKYVGREVGKEYSCQNNIFNSFEIHLTLNVLCILNFSCLKFLIRFPLLIYKALLIVILFRILCVLICIFQRPLYSACSSSVTFQAVHESSRRLQSSLRFHCLMA